MEESLSMNDAQDYGERLLNNIIDGLPSFIGALAFLLISYVIAKLLGSAAEALANQAELSRRLHTGHGGNMVQRAVPNPGRLIYRVIFWSIFLFGVSLAIGVLGVPFLNDILRSVYGYLPNVFAALLIFLVASAVSAGIATLASNTFGETVSGKVIATAAPILVMSVSAFMILNQLKIAPEIVTITYAALVGSVALGMALAFGLGGRDIAADLLRNLHEKGRERQQAVAGDVRAATRNAQHKSRQYRNNLS